MSDLLAVDALRKAYGSAAGVPVLDGVTFTARKGEFLSVVGPSGCGKTTLLLALSGLLDPDRGTVTFKDTPVRGGTPAGMSVVFQDYSRSLMPWQTNLGNVVFGMRRFRKMSRREKQARAQELLAAVNLDSAADSYPWQLSGGMQQRVAIARGLAAESELLLLDEPLAAVDAQTRAEMQDLILMLAERFRQTCVLVTHDVDEAVYMADRILVLSQRPTRILHEIAVPLEKPRDQLATRESAEYLHIRHEVLTLIRGLHKPEGAAAGGKGAG